MNILLPQRLDDEGVDGLIPQLHEHVTTPDVGFDFSPITFALPFATLSAACAIEAFRDRRRELGLDTRYLPKGVKEGTRPPGSNYLAYVGFYNYLGIPHGKELGEARGSDTYVPIRRVTTEQLSTREDETDLGPAVERESQRLSRVVIPDEDRREELSYCFQETIRNAFEHSTADSCVVMAQRYAASGMVEVAVVDTGCGIQDSLSRALGGLAPDEALTRAILPGISGTSGREERGVWDNCGFGLYVLSELGRLGGEFVLRSSGRRLKVTQETKAIVAAPGAGTGVKIRVSLNDAEYFPNLLKNIVAEGEKQDVPGAIKRRGPSKSKLGGWC